MGKKKGGGSLSSALTRWYGGRSQSGLSRDCGDVLGAASLTSPEREWVEVVSGLPSLSRACGHGAM